jgi:transcriptional regulator with XRE-family HTH domain
VVEPEVAFGIVLRALRKERQLSQESLALDADLQRNYISLLERGINSASLRTIFKLAHVLQVSPTDMLKQVEAELHKPIRLRTRR